MNNIILQVKDLSISFDNSTLFSNLSFEIFQGEKVTIIGASGTGKSTLINTLCGFNLNFSGQITIFNMPLDILHLFQIRNKISWLPQELQFPFDSVKELFYFPFDFNVNRHLKPAQKDIEELFEIFNLNTKLLDKRLSEISGGQKQRIIWVSILLLKKPIMFLDEPTSALDEDNIKKVTDYLFTQKDLTIIAASHNNYWINQSDKIINIEKYAQ